MKRLLMATAAVLLMATSAQAGTASKPIPLTRGGYWETLYYPRNTDGNQMCVMHSRWTFRDGATGDLYFKWTGAGGLFMQITKSTWNLPVGQDVPLKVWLDKSSRDAIGKIRKNDAGTTIIQISIDADVAVGLMDDVAEADLLWVTFPQGSEKPWGGKMDGSRNAKRWLAGCVDKVRADLDNATQPVVPNATQPVVPNAVPTQPVKPASKKDDGSV